MRAYERNEYNNFRYPEDMKLIIDYLKTHGKILVKYSVIENLYYDFSEEKYDASWMSVDKKRLEEFEEYLNNWER